MGKGTRIEWIGLRKLERALDSKQVDAATRAAVGAVTTDIGARADELVPFDTGNLSRSQVISRPGMTGPIRGTVDYGGTAAPYALVQHEDLTLSHPPKDKGGSPVRPGGGRGPKYLQYAASEKHGTLAARIKAEMRLRGVG